MAAGPVTNEGAAPRVGLTHGEVISAGCALALLVLMFGSAWFGVDRIPTGASTATGSATAENAWHGLSVIRWLMLVTVLGAFAAAGIHTRELPRLAVARMRVALLSLSMLTAGALVFRVLIELPSPERVVDQKLGAVLGVIAALGIAFGAYEAVREQRSWLSRGGHVPQRAAGSDTAP